MELTLRAFQQKSSIGNDVVVLRDGAEALEYLIGEERQAGRLPMPEIVLLDLEPSRRCRGSMSCAGSERTRHMKRVPVVILDLGANEAAGHRGELRSRRQ